MGSFLGQPIRGTGRFQRSEGYTIARTLGGVEHTEKCGDDHINQLTFGGSKS